MAPRNTPRNWNDVQTAIATAAIVTTLGLWNLFAAPKPQQTAQAADPTLPPVEQPPADLPPTPMPQVKIFFTPQNAPQTSVQPVPQTTVAQQPRVTKKNKTKNGGTVTRTKTS